MGFGPSPSAKDTVFQKKDGVWGLYSQVTVMVRKDSGVDGQGVLGG